MSTKEQLITIVIVGLATALTRFLPFMIFKKKMPSFVKYLSDVLPSAVMSLLIIYCLKEAVFSKFHSLPELICIVFIIVIHKIKRNVLLSISLGTILYMFLVQLVFI